MQSTKALTWRTWTPIVAAAALVIGSGAPITGQPNPYTTIEKWGQLPEGRPWGSTSAVDVAPNGHIWVAERCGANTCAGSNVPPILEFDPSGNLLKTFGAGLMVFPTAFMSTETATSGSPMPRARTARGTRSSSSAPRARSC